jgi:hypothetical protein
MWRNHNAENSQLMIGSGSHLYSYRGLHMKLFFSTNGTFFITDGTFLLNKWKFIHYTWNFSSQPMDLYLLHIDIFILNYGTFFIEFGNFHLNLWNFLYGISYVHKWVSNLLISVNMIEELITGGLQGKECLWEGVRVLIYPRELSCEIWAAFYRRMERGFVLSSGPLAGPESR